MSSGDTEAQTRDYAIVVTLFCCGLRVSELSGLDWADLDLTRGQAWLRKSKGKREKVLVELPSVVVEAIQRHIKYRGTADGPVFHTRGLRGRNRDFRLETRSVGRIVRLLGGKIGIHLWPHAAAAFVTDHGGG